MLPKISSGQNTDDVDSELSGENQNIAPVVIDGVVLFNVNGVATYTAEQRATSISKRIGRAAGNPGISSDSVKIITEGDNVRIFAGDEFIMNLYETDAKSEKINRSVMAAFIELKIKNAIDSYRIDRSRKSLIKKSLYALGALFLLIVILTVFRWLIKKTRTILESRIRARIDTVQNKSFNLIQAKQLWLAFRFVFKVTKVVGIIIITGIFLQYILGLFPWTSNVASYTLELFLNPVNSIFYVFPESSFLLLLYSHFLRRHQSEESHYVRFV